MIIRGPGKVPLANAFFAQNNKHSALTKGRWPKEQQEKRRSWPLTGVRYVYCSDTRCSDDERMRGGHGSVTDPVDLATVVNNRRRATAPLVAMTVQNTS